MLDGAAGFIVKGQVQGVGFRWWARRRADALGLEGWIRNAADGSVEVAVRGAPALVDQFRAELWSGPPGARVSAVVEAEGLVAPGIRPGFEVRF